MSRGEGVLIALDGVTKRRAGRDRSFELAVPRLTIRQGSAVAITGPSGSGKSTLIDLIAMTLRPDAAARFAFAAPEAPVVDVMGLWRAGRLDALGRLRARHFGYVLQTGGLLPFLSVRDNIALPQRLLGRVRPEVIEELARRLDILDQLGERPARLSVGQRQRAAIARALAHRPAVVLADEPTASLDPVNAAAVMELFLELVAQSGASLVLATHDRDLVAGFGLEVVAAELRRQGPLSQAVFAESGYDASQGWRVEARDRP